jgi:hypothetical protein
MNSLGFTEERNIRVCACTWHGRTSEPQEANRGNPDCVSPVRNDAPLLAVWPVAMVTGADIEHNECFAVMMVA